MQRGLITTKEIHEKLKNERHVAIYGICFDFNKAELKPESQNTIEEITKFLKENPKVKLYIVGHTDNIGDLQYNIILSQKRAEAVIKELTDKYSIEKEKLKGFGVGPLAPVESNDTEEDRAKNRRVKLIKQ